MPEIFSNKYVILAFIAVIPLAWFVTQAALGFAQKFFKKNQLFHDRSMIVRSLRTPLLILLGLIGLHSLLPTLNLSPETKLEISDTIVRLYIAIGAWLVSGLIHLGKFMAYGKFDIASTNNLRARKIRTQFQFLERTANVILFTLGLGLILTTFESVRRIGGGLIASAGIVGIVVGFAAQKTLGTLLAGFQVAFTQPIRIDDVVVVEKEWGVIEEITLSYVVIRIWDKRRLIVPINYFTEKTFENWTRTESDLLSYVFLYFDFSLPLDQVRGYFFEMLKQTKQWDRSVAVVQVVDADDRTMKVRFLMGARNSSESFELGCLVREKIIQHVEQNFPDSLPHVRWPLVSPDLLPPPQIKEQARTAQPPTV